MRRRAVVDALIALTVFVWLGAAADVVSPNPAYAVGWYEYCWTIVGSCPGGITTCAGCVAAPGVTGSCGTYWFPWFCGVVGARGQFHLDARVTSTHAEDRKPRPRADAGRKSSQVPSGSGKASRWG